MFMVGKSKYVISFLLLLLFCSILCYKKEENPLKQSLLQNSMLYGEGYGEVMRFFPLKLKCKTTHDTLWISIAGDGLYNALNMSLCDYQTFSDLLVKSVEQDGYLLVDSAFFESCRKYTIIPNAVIDSVYQKEGINGLLENYVTKDGKLAAATNEQIDYLLYLLFQHRIVCNCGPDFVYLWEILFDFTGKEEEYQSILKRSKSTMRIPPFYLSGQDSLDYVNELKKNGEGWKLE